MSNIIRTDDKVATGSVYDMAAKRGERSEMVLANVDVIVAMDVSGSMHGWKWDKACQILADIQAKYQGRVALMCFDDKSTWHLTGIPRPASGGTMFAQPLSAMQKFDDTGMNFFFISDGQCFDYTDATNLASTFKTPVVGIFVGDDFDQQGFDQLKQLMQMTGGSASKDAKFEQLEEKIIALLGDGTS